MGRGRGRRASAASPGSEVAPVSQEDEIATLKEMAANLRQQMAGVMERLDQLEKGE